jgi:alpha-1,6-mannosyltransferase
VLAATPNLVEAPRTFLFFFVLMFAAYIAVLSALPRLGQGRALCVLLAVAMAARLVWLVAAPTLSTDAYRYVWDARVGQAGINPYAYAAAAPEVAHLRDAAIYPRLNHPTWRTIYPPGAQAFFRAVYAVAPDSVLAIKIALGTVELLGLALLVVLLRALDLPRNRIVVYAWNPLVLVEVWGSAHVDALVVTGVIGMALAFVTHRPAVAAALLGFVTLVKLYPIILLPLLARRAGTRVVAVFALVVVLGYAPALGSGLLVLGSLPRYLEQEYFNPGLARSVVDSPMGSILAMAAWVAWVVWWRRPSTLVDGALPLTGGFAVLSPNVFPWYVLWVVPFLALRPSPMWIAFTGTIAFAYAFFLYQPWAIPIWARLLEIAPLVLGTGGAMVARISVRWRKGVHNEMTFRA